MSDVINGIDHWIHSSGTMRISANSRVSRVGATEEENEELNIKMRSSIVEKTKEKIEKLGGIDAVRKRGDEFEYSSISVVRKSDNYCDIRHVRGMPERLFTRNTKRDRDEDFGYNMIAEIHDFMCDYYAGKKSEEELGDYFYKCCSDMRIYCCEMHYSNGQTDADNQQIVSQVYEVFAKENARAARLANREEGMEYYRSNNFDEYKNDIVYYNSDYYYQCEDYKACIRKIADSVIEKWGLEAIDYDKIEADSPLKYDGFFDFNSSWTFTYRYLDRHGEVMDFGMAPPRDFKFFFKENDSWDKSILVVWAKDCKVTRNVPFDSRDKLQYYLSDLVKFTGEDMDDYEEYNNFMKNVSIYTRWYGFQQEFE